MKLEFSAISRYQYLLLVFIFQLLSTLIYSQCPGVLSRGYVELDRVSCIDGNTVYKLRGATSNTAIVNYIWQAKDFGSNTWSNISVPTASDSFVRFSIMDNRCIRVVIQCKNNLTDTVISQELCNGMSVTLDSVNCKDQIARYSITGNNPKLADFEYSWERKSYTGSTWVITGSYADTFSDNVMNQDRCYRVRVNCKSNPNVPQRYTQDLCNRISPRKAQIDSVYCDHIGTKVRVVLVKDSSFVDTTFARSFLWEYTSTNGFRWDRLSASADYNNDTIILPLTNSTSEYRAYTSPCYGKFGDSIYWSNKVNVGLNNVRIEVDKSRKECSTNHVALKLVGADTNFFKNAYKVNWYSKSMNGNDKFRLIKMDSNSYDTLKYLKRIRVSRDTIYKAVITSCKYDEYCDTTPCHDTLYTDDEITDINKLNAHYCCVSFSTHTPDFKLYTTVGEVSHSLECPSEFLNLTYQNKDNLRNSGMEVSWYSKDSTSLNYIPLTNATDSTPLKIPLSPNKVIQYKLVSSLCPPPQSAPIDSSYDTIRFMYTTGPTIIQEKSCNDETYNVVNTDVKLNTTINNIFVRWQIKNQDETAFRLYTGPGYDQDSITLNLVNGLTEIKRSIVVCPILSCEGGTSFSGSTASAFLPYLPYSKLSGCSDSFVLRVIDDNITFKDVNGTRNRTKINNLYYWESSTDNINWSLIAGAISDTLKVQTSTNSGKFFRRSLRICPLSTNLYTSNPSYLEIPNPTFFSGEARINNTVCLDSKIDINVVGASTVSNATPTYYWQVSNDDRNWRTYISPQTNSSTLPIQTTNSFLYYRRLTMWCNQNNLVRVDSSRSVTLNYVQTLPWCEGFENQLSFGANNVFNCFQYSRAQCTNGVPSGPNIPINPLRGQGNPGVGYSHQPNQPQSLAANGKIITPAFQLIKGKTYRFSFFHIESGNANLSWDSLYVAVGASENPCDINIPIGEKMVYFSFNQWNRHYADFVPCSTDNYRFAIVYKEQTASNDNIRFDNLCVKEVERCDNVNNIARGSTFAPNKNVDRPEDNPQGYLKDNVTHQYCIGDTIMLTYQPQVYGQFADNYTNTFDYEGMTYQLYRKRMDYDFNVIDEKFVPMPNNSLFGEPNPLPGDSLRNHINRRNWLTTNIVVTDTFTFYKFVATCSYNGREFHSDSLKINGTHSIPYCEDWNITVNNQNAPHNPNVEVITQPNAAGAPHRFTACPTCWGSFGTGGDAFYSANYSNWLRGAFADNTATLVEVTDALGSGGDYTGTLKASVVNRDANINRADTNTKILVFAPMRFYKGRTYHISFYWSDNRTKDTVASQTKRPPQTAPLYERRNGHETHFTDSLYLMLGYGNQAIHNRANFQKIISPVLRKVQSNLNTDAVASRYHYFWTEYTSDTTATVALAIAAKTGRFPNHNGIYRFVMDGFCIDTLPAATDTPTIEYADPCNDSPTFKFPMELRVIPDGRKFPFNSMANSTRWCAGEFVRFELSLKNKLLNTDVNIWKKGWNMQWEYTDDPNENNWYPINPTYSPNILEVALSSKYRNYRVRLYNKCGKGSIVGPFNLFAPGGSLPFREDFENAPLSLFNLSCWSYNSTNLARVEVTNDEFFRLNQSALSGNNYVSISYEPNGTGNRVDLYTLKTPQINLKRDSTYRISFWYQDNGFSRSIDSVWLAWTYGANSFVPQASVNSRLPDRVSGGVFPKNFRNSFWKYYSAEHTVQFPINQPTRTDSNFYYLINVSDNGANANVYNYNFHIDNFEVKPKYQNDLAVIGIESPLTGCGLDTTSIVTAQIMNLGYLPQSNFVVSAEVDGRKVASATYTGTLLSNQIGTIEFSGVEFSPSPTNKKIKVWTELSVDQDKWDDTLIRPIFAYPKPDPVVDTLDSFCFGQDIVHVVNTPSRKASIYKNIDDTYPVSQNDTIRIPNFRRDTFVYASQSCSYEQNATPKDFSLYPFTYDNAANSGLVFHVNTSRTIRIRNVDVYVERPGNSTIRLLKDNQIIYSKPVSFTKSGLNVISLEWDVEPGTDYNLIYVGGTNAPKLIRSNELGPPAGNSFFDLGVNLIGPCSRDGRLSIVGSVGTPSPFYNYFFNWSIYVPSCESERKKVVMRTKPITNFALKDSFRVCRKPDYYIHAPKGNFTFLWNKLNSTKDSVLADSTGWYTLKLTNEYNCVSYDSTYLIVDKTPQFTLPDTISYCSNDTLKIGSPVSVTENVLLWSNSSRDSIGMFVSPGIKWLEAYDKLTFCKSRDSFYAKPIDPPTLNLGGLHVECLSKVDLNSYKSPIVANDSITWFAQLPAIVSSNGEVTTPNRNKYWGTRYDRSTQCKITDTVTVDIKPTLNLDLGSDVVLCGSTTSTVLSNKLLNTGRQITYRWSNTQVTPSIVASLPGKYSLEITDIQYGCTVRDSVNVTRATSPVFDLGPNVVKCATSHVISYPNSNLSGLNFRWSNGSTQNSINVTNSGRYALTVTNQCGESFTDDVYVQLDKGTSSLVIDLLPDTVYGCNLAEARATSDSVLSNIIWSTGEKTNSIILNKTQAVSVSVFNTCGSYTKRSYVIVDPQPVANFTIRPLSSTDPFINLFINQSTLGAKYLWTFGDGGTSEDYTTAYKYTKEGTFLVNLTVTNSCGSASINKEIGPIIDSSRIPRLGSSISQLDHDKLILLYPNPADQNTKLIAKDILDGYYILKVTNALGQTVIETEHRVSNGLLDININTRNLSNGEYFVYLTDVTGSAAVKKMTVLHK